MPRDDREQNFEKALAHNLRARVPPNASAAPQSSCPDAETLAAYHERLLAHEQMISWKAHIAACPACQEVLAHLEATDDLPVQPERQEIDADREKLLVMSAAAPARAGFEFSTAPGPPRSAQPMPGTRSALRWPWLAPAGALAAGLLVWVAIHETSAPLPELVTNHRQTAAPLPATTSASSEPQRKENAPLQYSQNSPAASDDRSAGLRRDQDAPAPKDLGNLGALHDKAAASKKAKPQELSREGLEKDENILLDRSAPATPLIAQVAKEEKQLQERAAAAPPPASPAPSLTTAESAPITAKPSSEARAQKSAAAGAVGLRAKQESQMVAGVLVAGANSTVRTVDSKMSSLVPAPHGTVIWRIGLAGIIERSTDAGATWTLQPSGVVADLIAGSAPSENVCWIVGRAGTVLRTVDGGAHWQKLSPPVQDDLTAVFAVNARRATVSPAQGGYQTTDNGATWSKLPPE